MVSTFSILCPCCGQVVEASDAGFTATTVEVAACESRKALGMVSFTMRKSDAYQRSIPQTVLQHRDGLVVFG